MAHPEQMAFIAKVAKLFPQAFTGHALDVGSRDFNGGNRKYFTGRYIGLDFMAGNNVDVVGFGHLYDAPAGSFDCIISAECFEHDFYYPQTVQNILRMLKRGGLFCFTCATIGRPVHGTLETLGTFTHSPDKTQPNYYKNLKPNDFFAIGGFYGAWQKSCFEINKATQDLYFWGIKK